MEADLDSAPTRAAIIHTTETGARSNCPYCAGRMITGVSTGNRIILLQGANAGRIATVTADRGFNDGEFLVHFDNDPNNYEIRIGYSWDKFAFAPIDQIPSWLCKLSIDDLSAIDEAVIQTAILFATNNSATWSVEILLPVLGTVRSRRLPITGADLWPTFEAHGFSSAMRSSFEDRFDFGIELLIAMVGRPPIKRKLVEPMSIGRYLTPSRLSELGPSRGIKIAGATEQKAKAIKSPKTRRP